MLGIFQKLIFHEKDILDLVFEAYNHNYGLRLTYFNQHSFNVAAKNSEYLELIQNNFNIYTDGFGITFCLKYFFKKKVEKFNASDLNKSLLEVFESERIKYFLIGGNLEPPKVDDFMKDKKYFTGYSKGLNIEIDKIILELKLSQTDVIMIGMGIPLQEKLAYELSNLFPQKIFVCVGNFLEFYFGTKKRAPKFLHNSGFEWVFRLATEPKRLWKRYLIGIPLFIFRIIKEKLKQDK